MELQQSGRLSWILLVFGLAAGLPADPSYRVGPRSWFMVSEDKTPSLPKEPQSGMSPLGGAGSGVFSGWSGLSGSSGMSGLGVSGTSGVGGSGLSGSGGSGFSVFGSSGAGGSGVSAGAGALQVLQELSSLGRDLVESRQMVLGQAWNNDQHVALGSVAKRPLYPSSHVVHYNSGYQRERDGRTDQKYVNDVFIHHPLPETGAKGGAGSKGQQVQRG